MKRKTFTILSCMIFFAIHLNAQFTDVPQLIITEWRGDGMQSAYVELTNVGSETIDLSKFTVMALNPNRVADINGDTLRIINPIDDHLKRLDGILEPSDQFVITMAYDAPTTAGGFIHRTQMLPHADLVVHAEESGSHEFLNFPEMEAYGRDSADTYFNLLRQWNLFSGGKYPWVLYYHPSETDSFVVDGVGTEFDPDNGFIPKGEMSVAGVEGALATHILVRKANVMNGNWKWDFARGVSLEDSEWIPIPHTGYNPDGDIYRTVGNHGDFHISVTSNVVTIDQPNAKLTVPWGILKGDSLIDELTLGDGMAWWYIENDIFEDSAHTVVQTGDTLVLYAAGNTLEEIRFVIEVTEPAEDMNLVFPKRTIRYDALDDVDFDGQYWGGTPFYVTENQPVIDTIGDVPFATRVDTLFKYVEKASNADWEIVWVDDTPRPDLKHGDILKVTAQNGNVKEYFIDVLDYEASGNALLSAIVWPDKSEFLEGWAEDTVPGFLPGKMSYTIQLPYGTHLVPALTAIPQDLNAQIKQERAISLEGGIEERTTRFIVTAEDDSTVNEYTVLFNVEKPDHLIQKYSGEPFFSEFLWQIQWGNNFIEVAHPGDDPLDLSEYLIIRGLNVTNPAEIITQWSNFSSEEDFNNRYYKYVPGYKFIATNFDEWQVHGNKIQIDPNVDPIVNPGDVFSLGKVHNNENRWLDLFFERSDIRFNDNPWDEEIAYNNHVGDLRWNSTYAIFKIKNDSILRGEKNLNDPQDFELVDIFGSADGTWVIAGREVSADWSRWRLRKKPEYFSPGTTIGYGFGTNADDSQWIVDHTSDDGITWQDQAESLGSHVLDPVTIHLSTVTSLVYKIDDGFEGELDILGVSNGESVSQFYSNLSKANENQDLKVLSGADGSEKADTDDIIANDTLMVTSADGSNVTKYAISVEPLDGNAVLTTVNTPSNIVIEIVDETGQIKGVEYGAVLHEIMDSLKVPELAKAQVINQYGELVPMMMLNHDSVEVATLVGDSIYVEVVAQNGDMITYRFDPEVEPDEAFVISSIYNVNQDELIISDIPHGTATDAFWRNIEVVGNASATLLDKAGFERTSGEMNYDDKLEVMSEDGSVTVFYYLTFLDEMNPEANQAPTATLAFTDTTLNDVTDVMVSATAEDDGLPFGSDITYKWIVLEGEAGNVTFVNDEAAETNVIFADTGTYVLQLTVGDGEKSSAVQVTIEVVSGVGIENTTLQSIKIYPNPASDKLTIELQNFKAGNSLLKIYDLTGKAVHMQELFNSATTISLDELEKGLYIIRITNENRTFTRKLKVLK